MAEATGKIAPLRKRINRLESEIFKIDAKGMTLIKNEIQLEAKLNAVLERMVSVEKGKIAEAKTLSRKNETDLQTTVTKLKGKQKQYEQKREALERMKQKSALIRKELLNIAGNIQKETKELYEVDHVKKVAKTTTKQTPITKPITKATLTPKPLPKPTLSKPVPKPFIKPKPSTKPLSKPFVKPPPKPFVKPVPAKQFVTKPIPKSFVKPVPKPFVKPMPLALPKPIAKPAPVSKPFEEKKVQAPNFLKKPESMPPWTSKPNSGSSGFQNSLKEKSVEELGLGAFPIQKKETALSKKWPESNKPNMADFGVTPKPKPNLGTPVEKVESGKEEKSKDFVSFAREAEKIIATRPVKVPAPTAQATPKPAVEFSNQQLSFSHPSWPDKPGKPANALVSKENGVLSFNLTMDSISGSFEDMVSQKISKIKLEPAAKIIEKKETTGHVFIIYSKFWNGKDVLSKAMLIEHSRNFFALVFSAPKDEFEKVDKEFWNSVKSIKFKTSL